REHGTFPTRRSSDLRDGVVAVVAWHWADPLALLISKPWLFGIVITERAGPRDEIELDIQRGGICSQQLRRVDAKQLAPEFTDISNAFTVAVVSQVGAVFIRVVIYTRQRQQLIC